MQTKEAFSIAFSIALLAATSLTSQAQVQLIWQVGLDDNAWPAGDGGGPNTTFVQEAGTNPLPGNPANPEVDQQGDDDYYFAGVFSTAIPSVIALYGDYAPVGVVSANEEAAERAFAGSDNDLRYHFNLPGTLQPDDLLSVTFDALNLDTGEPGRIVEDPRYGVEVYFNGVLVQGQIVIRPLQLGVDYATAPFTLASVNAEIGPGADNIVSLKGISYSDAGGGSWMGIDYIQLNQTTEVIPPAVFPWAVGLDDDGHPEGDGGGPNTSFVQESGILDPLPGSPTSPELDQQADNDYYFAGSYTTVITGNGTYTPVGTVAANEEAAERGFSGVDNELRYHFNLPNTLAPTAVVAVSFDALSLDEDGQADPRYGVEVYVNGVLVQPQVMIRPPQLGQTFTTPPFTLGSVNAAVGAGFDNVVTLRGINYSTTGGGDSLQIDYVRLDLTNAIPPPTLPWSVGLNDDLWPAGDGGGINATFMQESGFSNLLPGNSANDEIDDPDDDYYFAGSYTTVIPSNGNYPPAGLVFANEEAVARGFSGSDNELRYHFNLPTSLKSNDVLSVTFDALALDNAGTDPRYGVEVYFNGVLVQTQLVIRTAQLGQAIATPRFTAASVNAQVGPGFDNILTLKGISYSAADGGNSLGLDYVQVNAHPPVTFPWAVGRDDNTHLTVGDGGGTNTTFWQEAGGINALPGRPNNPEADLQSDNDYYFAGEYTTVIDSVVALYGPYSPVGIVLANEEGAERAFAGTDNDLRYHFNLPNTLQPTDLLSVTFDANNLDAPGTVNTDPRYGIEVYFNGVLVQPQIVIRPADLDVDYTTPEFTLASVNAQVGPGFDNIVSLKGISYNAEGGGNWMGIDYVQLNGPTPTEFLPPLVSGGQVTLNWNGTGALEWAPTVVGPWEPVIPAPVPPYSEAIVSGENRFFRLRK